MNDNLIKSLARLTGLKNNIPTGWVLRKYGDEFNSILVTLEKDSSFNLAEFVIPEHEFESRPGHRGKYCDREFLLMKIDGVLSYFTFVLQPEETKNKLGFF
ncbi:unnamed protein product [marine sediment metagenome]|uniref:Uncharacterized protein n=1 Tax=marine sediment metagenome TaxID=412755 RepID=X1A781_9ZZZZ